MEDERWFTASSKMTRSSVVVATILFTIIFALILPLITILVGSTFGFQLAPFASLFGGLLGAGISLISFGLWDAVKLTIRGSEIVMKQKLIAVWMPWEIKAGVPTSIEVMDDRTSKIRYSHKILIQSDMLIRFKTPEESLEFRKAVGPKF